MLDAYKIMNTILEEKIIKSAEKYIGMPIALSGGIDSSLLAYFIKPKFAISVELPGDEKYNEIEWSKKVADFLNIKHIIVKIDDSLFDESINKAVKAIGRPIPHFNIFPLFEMYKKLAEMGETSVVLGDGPDETMCGYARDLIITHLYKLYDLDAFKNYKPLLDKILPTKTEAIKMVTNLEGFTDVIEADIAMRPDMDDMSNGIAKYFGITNHRPYQDDTELDDFMKNLPIEEKISEIEYGKYALRKIAAKYLPPEVAWRKKKVGGPVYPVGKLIFNQEDEFAKENWLNLQQKILKYEI